MVCLRRGWGAACWTHTTHLHLLLRVPLLTLSSGHDPEGMSSADGHPAPRLWLREDTDSVRNKRRRGERRQQIYRQRKAETCRRADSDPETRRETDGRVCGYHHLRATHSQKLG